MAKLIKEENVKEDLLVLRLSFSLIRVQERSRGCSRTLWIFECAERYSRCRWDILPERS